ncbi:MAG: hypothetical protein KKA41_14470, partial [Proteobacteria bacterium]|nr:hypothetical protein [Pseudomonadota bacterium]
SSSYNGFASANFKSRYSSIPRVWSLNMDGIYEVENGSEAGGDSDDGYNFYASSFLDNYYQETKFFGYGGLDFGFRKLMGATSADDPYSTIQVGVGYGRVYDATPLAQALRIVEDLRNYDVLSRDLTDAGYVKLAQIIDKKEEFETKYSASEYKKYWYEAMGEVLKEDGALESAGLNALGVIRIQEILDEERFSTRNHGWLVRGGVGYILSNYIDDTDDDPTLNAAFEYYRPLSYKLQFNEIFQYSTVLSDHVTHNIQNTLSLTYEISNKIDWENSHVLALTLPTEDGLKDQIANTFSTGFYYYLTNTVSASATLSLSHLDDNIDDNGNDDVESRIFLGIRYRLL